MKEIIRKGLDIFYPVFKRIMTFEVYRYLAVGGICFFINFCIFHLSYYLIYIPYDNEKALLSPHFKALLTSLSVTLPIGFFLTKQYVFQNSKLKEHFQFLRYAGSTILMVYLSKVILDVFIIKLNWNITISFLLNILIIQSVNFFIQKKISFSK